MYIGLNEKNKKENLQRGQFVLSLGEEQEEKEEYERLEAPHDMLIKEFSEDAILHWRGLEFEMFERDKKWYLYATLALAAIVAYAIFTNSLIMAIVFILIGVVGYIYINKEPRVLNFAITGEGIVAGREIYPFANLKSFWIFYEPEGLRVISLRTDSYLNPFLHIPICEEDPTEIREILLGYLPEEKEDPGMLDTLDRVLRL